MLLRLDDDELRPIVDKGLLGPARQASDVALRVVALHVLAHHDDEGVEHFGLVLSELGASAPYDVHHTIQGLGGSLDGLVVALVAVLELRHAGHKRKLMRACEVVVARVVVARVVVAREMVVVTEAVMEAAVTEVVAMVVVARVREVAVMAEVVSAEATTVVVVRVVVVTAVAARVVAARAREGGRVRGWLARVRVESKGEGGWRE